VKSDSNDLEAIELVAGISDGSNTEIVRGKIQEDADVIVGASARPK